MSDLNKILGQLKEGLIEIYGGRLKGLRLFGSRARNEAVAGSDVDIALVLDAFDDSWREIERTGGLVSRICLENNVVISLLPVRERDWQPAWGWGSGKGEKPPPQSPLVKEGRVPKAITKTSLGPCLRHLLLVLGKEGNRISSPLQGAAG